jgi:hypothetical protein
MGMFVVPEENELIKSAVPGIKYPRATPIPIAIKIHKVRNLSRKLKCFRSVGLQLLADINYQ